jgi:hypothetical protein
MKRQRQQAAVEHDLGALEFAAALNGDDPRLILGVLKRFAKIVRKERQIALGDTEDREKGDDSSSYESNSEGENENDNGTTKRFKSSETWKEDSKSYHVPFVGTSVAGGGRDRGTVIMGQWPTGLLQAYLERSPLAVELTGDSFIPPEGNIHRSLVRKKQGKLSQAIYKSYLKALAELVTAAIPKDVLEQQFQIDSPNVSPQIRRTDETSNNSHRFLIAIIKDRVPGLLNLLQEETKRGKGTCGPMVPYALHILSRLAMTGVDNSRHIVRVLEQSIPEGTWKAIVRLPPVHKHKDSEKNDGEKQPTDLRREMGRTAVLALARALVGTKDTTVLQYCSSSGSKDRKVSSGVLVLALRECIRESPSHEFVSHDDAYYHAIAQLLSALRNALEEPSSRLLSTRRWVELLSADVLQNLCDVSLHAPPLSYPSSFQAVLEATDMYASKDLEAVEEAGIEARRLLWPLLVDPSRSPLLHSLRQHESFVETGRADQALIRSMCRLLDTHPSLGKLGLQHCFHQGILKMPKLLPIFFDKVMLPDSTKQPFSFLARLRFVSKLIREGPSLSQSLSKTNITSCVVANNTEPILRVAFPVVLRRNTFSKALQGKNALVVGETLKSLICVLQSFEAIQEEVKEFSVDDGSSFAGQLSTKLANHLPDIQVVLSVLSRFDLQGDDKAAPVVHGHLSQLLLSYASTLPHVLTEVKFDWMKLIPSAGTFCKLPLFLQIRLLRTLETILGFCEVS